MSISLALWPLCPTGSGTATEESDSSKPESPLTQSKESAIKGEWAENTKFHLAMALYYSKLLSFFL